MALKRINGQEQPHIPAGPFKIRIPLVHFEWQWPEAIQALFMCATCLGAIPVLEEYLGVSFEVALTMVIINGFLYMLHFFLGDPVVPGWITPAIPLVMAHLAKYPIGPIRTKALIALQIEVALVFLILGSTGLAFKLVKVIPNSIKAGIILGAGISALINVFQVRFAGAPISISVGTVVAFYLLFSAGFKELSKRNKLMYNIGNYGMLPAIIVALIVGPLAKEIPVPQIEWGIAPLKMGELISGYTIFGIGFPGIDFFIAALPLLIAVYIIAFGDFVLAETVIKTADIVRQDEILEFNPNRSNLISGIRNGIMSIICPYTQLCGPLWAAVTVSVAERYKNGQSAMYSFWGGIGTFRIMTFVGVSLMPIVSLVKPTLPIALAMTLLVQGFACAYIAINMMENNQQRGVATVMAIMMAIKGSAWGLATGIILFFLCETGIAKSVPAEKDKSLEG
jgi:hypothetical protein